MSASALLEAAGMLPGARYAVMDGAHFDDLPAELRARHLSFAPLYLEASDEDGMRAGPYLVSIDDRHQAERAIGLAEAKPAITFWSWPGPFTAIRRHLRGLNLCQIPSGEADAEWDTVMFRHWDPNVLAVTLPVLTAEQQSRFLGEAGGLAFDAPEHGGVVRVERPDGLPEAARKMLQFVPAQMSAIAQRRESASQRKIASYLREVAPEQTRRMDERTLSEFVARQALDARSVGIEHERDIGRWAYLSAVTAGKFTADPTVRKAFADGATTRAAKLDLLLEGVAHD